MSDCRAGETNARSFCVSDKCVTVKVINENKYNLIIRCPDKEPINNCKESGEDISTKRCDLMCRKDSSDPVNYYVEIKTSLTDSKQKRAFSQLLATIKAYQDDYPGSRKNAYIVYRRDREPAVNTQKQLARSHRRQQRQESFGKQAGTLNGCELILSKPDKPGEIKIE